MASRALEHVSDSNRFGALLVLKIVSTVAKHGGKPTVQELSSIGWAHGRGLFTETMLEACFLGAVETAKNPFVPGITLSIALMDTMKRAPNNFPRTFTALQESIDELLLEVLERLPRMIRGFPAGITCCHDIFEPETTGALPKGFTGPLGSLLQREHQTNTFCRAPLVMNFLSRKFTRGLPDMRDSEYVLQDDHTLDFLRKGGLVIEGDTMSRIFRGQLLQGIAEDPTPTLLAGAQFIIAGVVANPRQYYKVPKLRMLLDLMVYLVLVVLFDIFILLHKPGSLTSAEVGLGIYIVVSLFPLCERSL